MRKKRKNNEKTHDKTVDERKSLWYNTAMEFFRAVSFDIGDKRIGVAASDPFGEYSIPSQTYFRTKNFETDVKAIAEIAKSRGAGVVVCGLPVNFDGTPSVQTQKTERFITALKKVLDIPVETEDERLTTAAARETQIEGGIKREKRKQSIDSIAAAYILDGYLSRRKKQPK